MKRLRTACLLAAAVTVVLVLLSGCNPPQYTDDHAEKVIETHRAAVEACVRARAEDARITELGMSPGRERPSGTGNLTRYASNVLYGRYETAGNTVNFFYDTETGALYTDALLEKLKEEETARIRAAMEAEGFPNYGFKVTGLRTEGVVQSHGVPVKGGGSIDPYAFLIDALPADLTEADLPAFAARGFDGFTVISFQCSYDGSGRDRFAEALTRFLLGEPAYRLQGNLKIEGLNTYSDGEGT